MLAVLCHDFGKPATTALLDGRIRSYEHEAAGVAPTLAFLDRLNIHTLEGFDLREQVVQLVSHHLTPSHFHKNRERVGDGTLRRLARKLEPELLYRVSRADCRGRKRGGNAALLPAARIRGGSGDGRCCHVCGEAATVASRCIGRSRHHRLRAGLSQNGMRAAQPGDRRDSVDVRRDRCSGDALSPTPRHCHCGLVPIEVNVTKGRRVALIAIVAALLIAAAWYQFGGHRTAPGQAPLAELNAGSLDRLRADFNGAANETRMILLLSPT